MARRFLYVIALSVVLVIAGLLGLRHWARELSEFAFVPHVRFEAPPPLGPDAWGPDGAWLARAGDQGPAGWLPPGVATPGVQNRGGGDALVFYVHPSSLFDRNRWNASLPDPLVDAATDRFVQAQASAFNAAEVWAPRYRQATVGAMWTDRPEGARALAVALGDVRSAFAAFLAQTGGRDGTRPIVLVGHSQGALLLEQLIARDIAGTPLARRIAAAYVVGWPVSREHDLPALGLPACTGPDQAGCVLSWMSYAEPADTAATLHYFERDRGLDGQSRKGGTILCTNPLTGGGASDAPASANLGTLGPAGVLVPGMVPARCGPKGFLLIGPGPQLGGEVLPGNNYHVYDIPLFWANVRADVARRIAAWDRAHG